MTPLHQMSYEEFGKLRFLDYFPKTDAYKEDHEGGLEAGIGLACTEGYRDTLFASVADAPWQTGEMMISFENGERLETEANTLFKKLGLGLRMGMTHGEVIQTLPSRLEDMPTYVRCVVGNRWPYYVDCFINQVAGVFKVWICRKDLADQQIEAES